MRVIATIAIHNEAEFLPLQIAWLREQGVMIHVIDNDSTDGSRANCEALGVTVTPLETRGAFDLSAIQKERARIASGYEHDWHLYCDADEWNLFPDGIVAACLAAENADSNVIRVPSCDLYYTGEVRQADPRRGFFYGAMRYGKNGGITRLHRRGAVSYHGDGFRGPCLRILTRPDAVNLNFGGTKPAHCHEAKLARRALAWERGMGKCYGVHMLESRKRNYLWDRTTLTYLPGTTHWPLAREIIGP